MMEPGLPAPAGAVCDVNGVNFAIYSAGATAVELCLFDHGQSETRRFFLPQQTNGVWHGYLPGCAAGQRYGYRVHGAWSPDEGLRFNPAKLLLDPYTRRLDGCFRWSPAVFDFQPGEAEDCWRKNELDSAPFLPRCVVTTPTASAAFKRPHIAWADSIIYEANVRGFTMRHNGIPKAERGKFRGLSNAKIVEYIKSLGITSLELMPVHSFVDEAFLVKRGLRNLWGYNSLQFFVPDARFACEDATAEFREMVRVIHDAGIEVILDVAYNHTGEGDEHGPTLSFRGIDNLTYYRTQPGNPGRLANDTGCGNSINADHPAVQALIVDSLMYWHREMGVDGFRFDLATILGRNQQGFDAAHPLLQGISQQPELRSAKLIAEPWDPGPGGYQLGRFPSPWREWNDRYRDTVRRFWRGDSGCLGEFAQRIHGSADIFEASGRPPCASINFVTSHDGFTLQDVVSYEHRNNHANGQENQDGHSQNYSCNYGIEGESDDDNITRLRFQQRLNLLATLLLSQGLPMLLAGDEFGNTQNGNNNAYAQDNETGWLDWQLLQTNQGFLNKFRELTRLRREIPLLRLPRYLHGQSSCTKESRQRPARPAFKNGKHDCCTIQWLKPGGEIMQPADWHGMQQVALLLTSQMPAQADNQSIAILVNAATEKIIFKLPQSMQKTGWNLRFFSSYTMPLNPAPGLWQVDKRSITLMEKKAF